MASKPILRDLKLTFGSIPDSVREHLKYISYNEDEDHFTCQPCDKTIKTVYGNDKSMTKNFEQHFKSKGHQNLAVHQPSSIIWDNLVKTFDGNVPQIIKNNFDVMEMDGNDFYCEICRKIIQISDDISTSTKNFSYHLLSTGHEENLEKFRELLGEVCGIYGSIPISVMNQCDFLVKIARNIYECTVCEKQLKVNPYNRDNTVENFNKHLQTATHLRNAQEAKAFSTIPGLHSIFPKLPSYMLNNIEYISMNQSHFFCSLCNVNIIYNVKDIYGTKYNLKVHFSMTVHEEKLKQRMDPNNDAYTMLKSLFESLPDSVSDNLKYLSLDDNMYSCNICWQEITEKDNYDDDDVLNALSSHCCSSDHGNNVMRKSEIVEDLEDLFGSVPESIKENIMHIEFEGGVNFSCTLCKKTLKSKRNGSYDSNTSVTQDNFEKHLHSYTHKDELSSLESVESQVENILDSLCSPIPQYISNNLQHLGFHENGEDFWCYLCDETVVVDRGNKKSELTLQNLRVHFLSAGHMKQLKHQATNETEAMLKLEAIFYKVPSVILDGVNYLELQEDYYVCNLCDASLIRSPNNLLAHFNGKKHQTLSKEHENNNAEALSQLEYRFWRVPEFLLKNIDFLVPFGEDLFCILCQEKMSLDEEDLEETENELRLHVNSQRHQSYCTVKV